MDKKKKHYKLKITSDDLSILFDSLTTYIDYLETSTEFLEGQDLEDVDRWLAEARATVEHLRVQM